MNKLFQICLEMLNARNYTNIIENEDHILAKKYNGEYVCCFFQPVIKFNIEYLQEYINIMNKLNLKHMIILYKDNITPIVKKTIDDLKDIIIEFFIEDELLYNITKHYLVPKHELLYRANSAEANELKKKFNNKFPILLKSDPVSRFYGFNKGDIIKITRKNNHIIYRIVK